MTLITTHSEQDRSVNFIQPTIEGMFESRFVSRSDDYFIVYLSSQSGCDQACRMCHLTATGQTSIENASKMDLIDQAIPALKHYVSTQNPAGKLHYNFMARGEPLNNPTLNGHNGTLTALRDLALTYDRNLDVRFLVSTIMPKNGDTNLVERFAGPIQPNIYYSLYSVDPTFRKRWLGKAEGYKVALEKIVAYQDAYPHTNNKIHFAFIEGENDSEGDVRALCQTLTEFGFNGKINIVRYNPYSEKYGRESSESVIHRNALLIRESLAVDVTIVPKVGFDVKASCGMFVNKEFFNGQV